ncbi:MAG: hypothetical protein LQ340_003825 [Diploschistes diacapsis]|nr:MAG: hypothetical protein LQ340_003825 [Diploschistes diacapsis]
MVATAGQGVNIVLNFLSGDLLAASWRACASFGRFMKVGKRDIVDSGRLDMKPFLKNLTFSVFDLNDLFYIALESNHQRDIYQSLLHDSIELVRSKQVQPAPIKRFDVSEVIDAMRYQSNNSRIVKVLIRMNDPGSIVPLIPQRYQTRFDPDKPYILIGCLGGLGRSLARWMAQRGARNLIFMGRSGANKPAGRALVADLEKSGINVEVFTGDNIYPK